MCICSYLPWSVIEVISADVVWIANITHDIRSPIICSIEVTTTTSNAALERAAACEKEDLLLFAVIKEEIEGPKSSRQAEWIILHVGDICVHLCTAQNNFGVDGTPQLLKKTWALFVHEFAEITIDQVHDTAKVLTTELIRFEGTKVIVWEGGVHSANQIHEEPPCLWVTELTKCSEVGAQGCKALKIRLIICCQLCDILLLEQLTEALVLANGLARVRLHAALQSPVTERTALKKRSHLI
mmetsp:Transcript_7561/g.15015  ORF Transcript_7561/g.15015 Transcript_7561/m.15015 type:complete len:241 (+) Transcript_7561:1044-1766(+)